MVVLARRGRDSGPARQPPAARVGVRSRLRFVVVLALAVVAALVVTLLGLLGGDTWLRTGDIALWLNDEGAPLIRFALDERAPRVAAAVLAGAALALSGSLVQSTCRNPLAEPGILGITGGAGVGAVIVVTGSVTAAPVQQRGARRRRHRRAGLVRPRLRAGLAARPRRRPAAAHRHRHLVRRRRADDVPAGPLQPLGHAAHLHLAVRDDVRPHLRPGAPGRRGAGRGPPARLGRTTRARPARSRRGHAAAGRGRPRAGAARSCCSSPRCWPRPASPRSAWSGSSAWWRRTWRGRSSAAGTPGRCPVAVLVGAVLLGAADLIGRTAIAPAQVPAGLVVALIGAPYFVYLLARSRA